MLRTDTRPTQIQASQERPRFAAFHSRNFRLLWGSLILSNAGSQMQTVGQGYLIYYILTHSTFWLGMASLAFALPTTLFPLFGGGHSRPRGQTHAAEGHANGPDARGRPACVDYAERQ